MKRVWELSIAAQAELFCFHRTSTKPKPLNPFPIFLQSSTNYICTREFNTHTHFSNAVFRKTIGMFSRNPHYFHLIGREDLRREVAILGDQLVRVAHDSNKVLEILEESSDSWFWSCPDGFAFVALLDLLDSWPDLALMVLNWRRKRSFGGTPMAPLEYSKGIKVASRSRNIDLAVELFNEAANKQIKTTATYNALMSAFMFNGLADKCQSLFRQMKMDASCSPNIVTYNILISVFGRMLLINHVEATLEEIHNSGLSPNTSTYNNLIAAYITAWKWDRMEQTFQMLKSSPVKPDTNTYLLMLRGYGNSGNLIKMERIYQLVRDHVNENEIPLIRSMICAYCKSSAPDRIKKIEELLKLIPEEEYRSWLNVSLIRLYAQEDWLEEMENSINDAFEHKASVVSYRIMRCIIAVYFRKNLIDRLENLVRRAVYSNWRICRSLYHCKMVMYGSQKRLEEMENVLDEMKSVNLNSTKRTLWIMYNAYVRCGQRSKVEKILGLMCKRGYDIPMELVNVQSSANQGTRNAQIQPHASTLASDDACLLISVFGKGERRGEERRGRGRGGGSLKFQCLYGGLALFRKATLPRTMVSSILLRSDAVVLPHGNQILVYKFTPAIVYALKRCSSACLRSFRRFPTRMMTTVAEHSNHVFRPQSVAKVRNEKENASKS